MMHITSGILITGLLTKTPENIKRLKRNMLYSLSPALLWHLLFFFLFRYQQLQTIVPTGFSLGLEAKGLHNEEELVF